MSKSHFNAANIWGRIVEHKKEKTPKGTRFLSIHINCTGQGGNVHAYGRLWGDERIDSLIEHLKKDPYGIMRFRGFFSQYLATGVKLTNFSIYQWDPAHGQAPRAAFILRGEVAGYDTQDNEGLLKLKVIRKGRHEYRDVTEEFDLWTVDPEQWAEFEQGQIWELKGYLQQGAGEDEFGAASGPVRPYILQSKRIP